MLVNKSFSVANTVSLDRALLAAFVMHFALTSSMFSAKHAQKSVFSDSGVSFISFSVCFPQMHSSHRSIPSLNCTRRQTQHKNSGPLLMVFNDALCFDLLPVLGVGAKFHNTLTFDPLFVLSVDAVSNATMRCLLFSVLYIIVTLGIFISSFLNNTFVKIVSAFCVFCCLKYFDFSNLEWETVHSIFVYFYYFYLLKSVFPFTYIILLI